MNKSSRRPNCMSALHCYMWQIAAVTTRSNVVESNQSNTKATNQVINWVDDVYSSACLVYHVIKEQHPHFLQWTWITVVPYLLLTQIKIDPLSLLWENYDHFFGCSLEKRFFFYFFFIYHLSPVKLAAVAEKGCIPLHTCAAHIKGILIYPQYIYTAALEVEAPFRCAHRQRACIQYTNVLT